MAQQKIGNAAYTYEPVSNRFERDFERESDADSTVKVLDLPDSDIREGGPNVFNEALLEVVSIVSL
jgi:hypothetical protein